MKSNGGCGSGNDGRPSVARRAPRLLAGVLLLACSSYVSAGPDADRKISPEVARRAYRVEAGTPVPVIVQTYGEPGDEQLLKLNGRGGTLKRRHEAIRGYSAVVPAGSLEEFAADPEVERVSL